MQQLENPPATASPRQITDKSIIPFLKENRDKNRLAKVKSIFDNSTELKNEFLNFVQSIIDKEEAIRNINALKENILNSEFFKTYSYICHVLQTFSKSHELQNFIIQLQKLNDLPVFQFANKINNLYDRLQLPWEKQEAYNLKFFNAINAHDSKQIKDVIDEIYKDNGLILSKKSITKYFIDEYIFISREHKNIKELCKDRVVINALEKLKIENKQYQNISIENGISQAFSYFKELEEKDLPPLKKDDRKSQYLRIYKKAHGDYCYIISNLINNALFFCNGKFARSTSKIIKINGEEKQFHQITINHFDKHYIYIYSENEIKFQPIHGQIWALLLQEINSIVNQNKDEIDNAIKEEKILEKNYRTGKMSINEFIALKNPANFLQFRCKKISAIQDFCDIMAEISIKARYKDQYEWKEFDSKLFDSIRINDNNEIEYTLTDKYIKMNRLTLSSQVSFPISAFKNSNISNNYDYIFNIYVLLFIHNRINANDKEKRFLKMSKIMDWLGLDINEERKKEKLSLLPEKNYNYLNKLCDKLGLSILFDSNNLETLKNYKWTSPKIKKDTLKEFEETKITFSFDDKMEKILQNNTPKSVNEYREEAKELKKQK